MLGFLAACDAVLVQAFHILFDLAIDLVLLLVVLLCAAYAYGSLRRLTGHSEP